MLKTHGLFVYKVFPYDLTLSYNTSVTDDDDRQTVDNCTTLLK